MATGKEVAHAGVERERRRVGLLAFDCSDGLVLSPIEFIGRERWPLQNISQDRERGIELIGWGRHSDRVSVCRSVDRDRRSQLTKCLRELDCIAGSGAARHHPGHHRAAALFARWVTLSASGEHQHQLNSGCVWAVEMRQSNTVGETSCARVRDRDGGGHRCGRACKPNGGWRFQQPASWLA